MGRPDGRHGGLEPHGWPRVVVFARAFARGSTIALRARGARRSPGSWWALLLVLVLVVAFVLLGVRI